MAQAFGQMDVLGLSSPGRTELGGNHTDHNHGRVLAAAVHLDCMALVSPRDDTLVRIVSEGFEEPIEVDVADLALREEEKESSHAMVRGVAAGLAEREYALGGFDACVAGSIPMGAGLSSSAAFEVLVGQVFNQLFNQGEIDDLTLALVAKDAENNYFGKPCGFMDQMACAMQGILHIDLLNPDAPQVEQVAARLDGAGYTLAVVNTGGSHEDLTEDYAAIKKEMHEVAELLGQEEARGLARDQLLSELPRLRRATSERALLRTLHFIEEDERVPAMARSLAQGDMEAFLALVRASGNSSWLLLQNCVSPSHPTEQPIPLALALTQRLLSGRGACRVHGGGFAGTIQAYVPEADYPDYARAMEKVFGPGSVMELKVRQALGPLIMP
ncbi:MAG: galactokinase [Desulfovibrio sp.]|nr:MAG: galactokinase [Desulfovibrio sp.]